MNAEEFDIFLEETFERIRLVLASKGNEYVANDAKSRFHNFDISAAFKSESSEQALWGFVTKQLVSLSDMVKCDSTSYPIDLWDEKLGDVINYMILLRGIVYHKHNQKVDFGFAVGENIEEHLVVVTNDDPEIHILPEPTLPPLVNANEGVIGIEFNGVGLGASVSSATITGTVENLSMPPRPGPDTLRKSKYPDLSAYTGR
jgi:hypothetical protein